MNRLSDPRICGELSVLLPDYILNSHDIFRCTSYDYEDMSVRYALSNNNPIFVDTHLPSEGDADVYLIKDISINHRESHVVVRLHITHSMGNTETAYFFIDNEHMIEAIWQALHVAINQRRITVDEFSSAYLRRGMFNAFSKEFNAVFTSKPYDSELAAPDESQFLSILNSR